jgi:DNA-directed RNA polymerase subunit RPC12/RpoP
MGPVDSSFIIAIAIGWVAFSILAGFIAQRKGRSFFWFFLASIFFSPLIGVLAAWGAWSNTAEIENDKIYSGELKRCSRCGEAVRQDAVKCRHCGADLLQKPDQPSVLRPSPGAVQLGRSLGKLFRK